MKTIGVYPGTFDPITNGHLDIIKRSLQFCDELVIAIGINSAKKTMFTEEERRDLVLQTIAKEKAIQHNRVASGVFQGLLVNYAKEVDAKILIRGIRSVSDFEYEINLANINKTLAPNIETVFLPTSPELAVVSSSMVKEIARLGGDIRRFVPAHVVSQINDKFGFIKTSNHEK